MVDELSRNVRAKILQESECIEEESTETFDFILDLMRTGKDLSIKEVVDNCLQEISSRSVAYTTQVYKFSGYDDGICETIKERNVTNRGVERNVKGAFLKKHAAILRGTENIYVQMIHQSNYNLVDTLVKVIFSTLP